MRLANNGSTSWPKNTTAIGRTVCAPRSHFLSGCRAGIRGQASQLECRAITSAGTMGIKDQSSQREPISEGQVRKKSGHKNSVEATGINYATGALESAPGGHLRLEHHGAMRT
jgi:hypothetical protein